MEVVRRGGLATLAKGVADDLRGSLILLALFGAFVGILAIPVYLMAILVAGLGAPTWLTIILCVGLGSAELSGLLLIPHYLDRLEERREERREREEFDKPAGVPAPTRAEPRTRAGGAVGIARP